MTTTKTATVQTKDLPLDKFEAVIGLEVHSQLKTRSKMFCGCASAYTDTDPNSRVCPVCLGMPGTLPVINRKAVEYAIMTGLALNSTIAEHTKFDRKNYPYPDLMKGYQISQFDMPLCGGGWLSVETEDGIRNARLTRVHLEEDTAKLMHVDGDGGERWSRVDVNRSGTPLMEIVGEPDLRSAEEARQYLVKLRTILQYLGVSTGNMEEGSFRCDANISIRPRGSTDLQSKVEVKNMNSFRAVYRALRYEFERQVRATSEGLPIHQETRGWVEDRGVTVSQRSKEYAHDYRYFPEPDLPAMKIDPAWVEEIRAQLPELPEARVERFVSDFGLQSKDADTLVNNKAMADFFEEAVACSDVGKNGDAGKRARDVGVWLLGDFLQHLNAAGEDIGQAKISPSGLSQLIDLVDDSTLSGKMAKDVFQEMYETGKAASDIVKDRGLVQITDSGEISAVVDEALAQNPQAVADFAAGNARAIGFLVGQVMKATRGKANPAKVNELLRERMK